MTTVRMVRVVLLRRGIMKTSLSLMLVLVGCVDAQPESTSTDPTGGKADDVVETTGELAPQLPVLVDPKLVFNPPPQLAAVQPTADLHFTYSSCAAQRWTLKRELMPTLEGEVVLVQVETDGFDCFGPTVARKYTLQVTSDAAAETQFVVLNPSQLTFSFAE